MAHPVDKTMNTDAIQTKRNEEEEKRAAEQSCEAAGTGSNSSKWDPAANSSTQVHQPCSNVQKTCNRPP